MFCGAAGVSREHVFAKWIRESFGPVECEAQHLRRASTPEGGRWHQYSGTKMLEIVGRRFCERCNNGWMAQMDEEIRAILEPLLHGTPRRLSPLDQHEPATWITKIIMTQQATNLGRGRVVPEYQYNWFRQHRSPLPGSNVWVFHYTDHDHWPYVSSQYGASFGRTGEPPPEPGDPLNGFSVAFALGEFGAWVFNADLPGSPPPQPGPDDDQVRLIWPVRDGEAVWPPPRPADEADVASMARRMPDAVALDGEGATP
jgi:hypothetical protein